MNGQFSIHDLLPYLDFTERVVPIGGVQVVAAEPNAERVAIQFAAHQVGPVIVLLENTASVSTRQGALPGEGWQVAFGVSPYFHISQYGNATVSRWYAIQQTGVLAISVFEWFWKPR